MKKICLTLIAVLSVIQFTYAQWTTNGTSVYYNSGNVGVGTTTPAYNLDVTGTVRTTGNVITPSVNGMYIGNGYSNESLSFAFGINVLTSTNNTGIRNYAIGQNVLTANTTGQGNLGIGSTALYTNTTGQHNLGIGTSSLYFNTIGSYNVGVGRGTLQNNTFGNYSTAVGENALQQTTTGTNSAFGYVSGSNISTGSGNTFMGTNSGASVTTGSNNTILGGSAPVAGATETIAPFTSILGITSGSNNTIVGANISGLSPTLSNYVILGDGSGNQRLTIDNNGNTGIGTTTPNVRLQVNGALITGGSNSTGNIDPSGSNGYLGYLSNTGNMLIGWNRSSGVGETDFIANPGAGTTGGFAFYNHANTGLETQLMYITGGGNVLINKNTQINTTYRLDVNGNVRANEIVVNTGGADFVFDHTYRLSSLSNLKKYIDRNHHLPEIASAKQMQADGLDVGKNEVKLLQKVEELTLYTIASDKHIKEEDALVAQQQALLLQLQNQLKAQQKEIDQLKNSSHQ